MNADEKHRTIPPTDCSAPLAGKRVLVVLGCLDMGGAERQAINWADCLLHRQQANVQVWGFRPPGRAAELCDRLGIPWRYVLERWGRGPFRWPVMLGRFARAVRHERPDILLPYTAFPNVICGLSWRLTGARVCVWNQLDAGLGLGSPAVPWAVRNTPLFLSNSNVGAEFLAATFRIPAQRIRVVRNPVRLQPPRDDRVTWRARFGADPSCFAVCMVANLHKHKDHTALLTTWRIVCDRLIAGNRRAVLLLAGRLDAAGPLRQMVHDLQLESAVQFLGEVDDVSGLLAAVDLGVFSSRSEGCPNAVLESMAAGLAVVATDCPGIREAVGEQGFPWLTPAGDTEGMAERILRLADDAALRAELGTTNRQRIESEFTLEQMNANLSALLPSALTTRRWP